MALSAAALGAIGTGVQTAGGLVSTIINSSSASKRSREAYEADLRNNLELAKYNNEYNYNLWKEQMEYNSPVEQRKRLEAAGLNPNFNAIEGTGNASNPPTSVIPTNLHHSRDVVMDRAQLRLASINAMTEQVGQLIRNLSAISALPANIPEARMLVLKMLNDDAQLKHNKAFTSFVDSLYNASQKLGLNYDGVVIGDNLPTDNGVTGGLQHVDISNSPLAQKVGLTNANLMMQENIRKTELLLKQYDLGHLKPQEEKLLKARIYLLSVQAGLTAKQSKWFVAQSLTKMGAMTLGGLLGMAKVLK